MKRAIGSVLVLLSVVGCTNERRPTAGKAAAKPAAAVAWSLGTPRTLQMPASASASIPALTAGRNGSLLLGWMEEVEKKKRYRFMLSRFDGKAWSEPRKVREGDDFFANWADTPKVAESGSGVLFAQWLQRSGSGTYDYAVNIARSTDEGRTWSKPVVPHTTAVKSEFGFVSMVPEQDGIALTWLDGRDMKHEGEGTMAIRFAKVSNSGTISDEAILDQRVCECCQTGMTKGPSGPIVVYRDRSESEIRDTGIVRKEAAAWSQPVLVNSDGWVIPGCPVNGPQVSANQNNVAVAWFTGSENLSRVRAAFSTDGAKSFSKPLQISSNESLGRVGLEMLDEKTAVVTWMEKQGEKGIVRARLLDRSGAMGEPVTIGETASARASGFPRIARMGDSLVVAWTIPGEMSRIAVSEIPLQKVN